MKNALRSVVTGFSATATAKNVMFSYHPHLGARSKVA